MGRQGQRTTACSEWQRSNGFHRPTPDFVPPCAPPPLARTKQALGGNSLAWGGAAAPCVLPAKGGEKVERGARRRETGRRGAVHPPTPRCFAGGCWPQAEPPQALGVAPYASAGRRAAAGAYRDGESRGGSVHVACVYKHSWEVPLLTPARHSPRRGGPTAANNEAGPEEKEGAALGLGSTLRSSSSSSGGFFPVATQQSKAAVRLKEDMKKIAAPPVNNPRDHTCQKVFAVSLQDLQQQGLTKNGLPAIVWDIVEYLIQHGLTQEGLFRVNGNMKMVDQLRLKYDRGEEVELAKDADVCSVASLLKLFLRELPDGVITSASHPRFIQLYQDTRNDAEKENSLKELIQELPDANYSLLKYLCWFLTQVAEHHVENRMNISNLATIFGPSCFHVPSGFEGMKEQEICNKIMAKMLENYNTLFELEHTKKDDENHACEELARIMLVKATCEQSLPISLTRTLEREAPKSMPQSKIAKSTREGFIQECLLPQPELSYGFPQISLRLTDSSACLQEMDLADEISFINSAAFFCRNRVCDAYSVTNHKRGKASFCQSL